jgi:hypothetical protein
MVSRCDLYSKMRRGDCEKLFALFNVLFYIAQNLRSHRSLFRKEGALQNELACVYLLSLTFESNSSQTFFSFLAISRSATFLLRVSS